MHYQDKLTCVPFSVIMTSVSTMTVIIDADACPVVRIAIGEAKKRNIPVTCVCDTSHEFNDDYANTVIVDKGRDSADLRVVNLCSCGDIVITQDYGVASMALAKKAKCINQNGLYYTEDNIDFLMSMRHAASVERRKSKSHMKGPSKRTKQDDEKFLSSFIKLLDL